MRISTTCKNVKTFLGEEKFEELWISFCHQSAKEIDEKKVTTVWIMEEVEFKNKPKTWASLAKKNPKEFIKVGLERGWLFLRVSFKPQNGKVWVSPCIETSKMPEEVVLAVERKASLSSQNKWSGLTIDLYTPLHQMHPGLTEHACLGMIECNKKYYAMLSDSIDPWNTSSWYLYQLDMAQRVAINQMQLIDVAGQKEWLRAKVQDVFSIRGIQGRKMSQEEVESVLNGQRKWIGCFSAMEIASIPSNARKFKLGEVVGKEEKKIVAMDLLAQLGLTV